MTDERIIELYWRRDESAVAETDAVYGKYCFTVANNVLRSSGDSDACVNDTYMALWQNIPPARPKRFRSYIAAITRNIALNMLDYLRADKRYDGGAVVLDEFWECIPDGSVSIDDDLVMKEAINGFLASLKKETRIIFMQRYWYFFSVKEISRMSGVSESNVKVILHRTRLQFKEYLERREISI